MKILILCFLFLSINVFAGYMSKAKMLNPDCNTSRPFYTKKKTCDLLNPDCIPVPSVDRICNLSELDTQVDNPESPKATKNEIVTCDDQADCELKNSSKTCLDSDEVVRIAENYSDIYCTKPNGFNKMTVKMIREDPVKKATHDTLRASELVKKNNRNTNRAQMKALMSSLKAGTDLNTVQRRKLDLLIIRKLIDE